MEMQNILYLTTMAALLLSCGQPNTVDIGEFKSIEAKERTIQVTGSADMEIIPDQIEFLIKIEEYYEEEFQKGKSQKSYNTKVPIKKIEEDLLGKLKSIGISEKQIIVQDIGNYWRYRSKKILISKLFSIQLADLSMIDKIISTVDLKGIDYMRIGALKHTKIHDYRKQVKAEALRAAKDKAKYLLSVLDKEVGEIINIKEVSNDYLWSSHWYGGSGSYTSNTSVSSGQSNEGAGPRTIKLRYQVEAIFEIK